MNAPLYLITGAGGGTGGVSRQVVEGLRARGDLPAHLDQHLATMALLHRAGRYDRATDDVERLTGQPASTVGQYITEHPEPFS